jgi:hypothetical protein
MPLRTKLAPPACEAATSNARPSRLVSDSRLDGRRRRGRRLGLRVRERRRKWFWLRSRNRLGRVWIDDRDSHCGLLRRHRSTSFEFALRLLGAAFDVAVLGPGIELVIGPASRALMVRKPHGHCNSPPSASRALTVWPLRNPGTRRNVAGCESEGRMTHQYTEESTPSAKAEQDTPMVSRILGSCGWELER